MAYPDAELRPGARNAVRDCLRIQPDEEVTVIMDRSTEEIGAALCAEVREAGATCTPFLLEDFGPRPHKDMPAQILRRLAESQVSIFAANAQEGELPSRMQMTRVVGEHRIRHAHMVNISRRIMLEGMRADFGQVDAISQKLWELASSARTVRATTQLGTDVTAELGADRRWVKTSGIISRDYWGNLPGGEIFTAPVNVNGRYVVDGVVGDYLCAKYGDLVRTPMNIDIKDGRMLGVSSSNRNLEREFWAYCHTDANSDRVGEFAIGTNIQVRQVIGQILQDEKIPGVHIAFGDPCADQTGADWSSKTHIDVVGTKFDIWIDDRKIMERGEFML
jgi:aminopeptidase